MFSWFLPVALVMIGDVQAVHSAAFATEAETPAQPPASTDNSELVSQYFAQMSAKRFEDALKTTEAFQLEYGNRKGRALRSVMQGAALAGLKRDREAQQQFAEAERLDPHSGEVSHVGFDAALTTNRFELAATFFDQLIARSPDLVRTLPPEAVWYFLRNEPKGEPQRNDDRRVALARLGYGGESTIGDEFVQEAIRILCKRGDLAGATELLRYLDEPRLIEDMLIQRRYASLWPALEAYAGPHLEKVRVSSVQTAEEAHAANPADEKALQFYINALRHAGRLDDAIAMASKLPATSEAMSKATQDMGWAINNVALAMHQAKRDDDADRLFKSLNEAPMEPENWRVSMKINRLELLVSHGKFAEALPLIEPTAKTPGSPYAEQLVRRLRYCTLSGLGRRDEAAI